MTWNELIDQAFLDIAVIQPGESITTAMRTNAQALLNQLLSSLSTEGATVYTQKTYTGALQTGQQAYTVGAGGSINTAERVQRLKSWRAYVGTLVQAGGPVLALEDFTAQAQQVNGETTAVPKVAGADTAYPLINLRVFPPPNTAATIELTGWAPITQIADFTVTPTLPEGWPLMLHLQLGLLLYPQYARQGGIPPELAANAMNAKASIVNQNTAGKPTPEAK